MKGKGVKGRGMYIQCSLSMGTDEANEGFQGARGDVVPRGFSGLFGSYVACPSPLFFTEGGELATAKGLNGGNGVQSCM